LSSLTFFSPRFAERAAPAAICWALDFAGMIASVLLHVSCPGHRDPGRCTRSGRQNNGQKPTRFPGDKNSLRAAAWHARSIFQNELKA
jgi:hypothetical protein